MPRLPQAEIDRVKQEVDLAEQVRRCGIELKRHGKDLIGLCPFHDDRSPSLVITPKKNLWNCLGACGEGGPVIDWVMRMEGISFRQAVELLRQGWEPTVEAKSEPTVTQSTRLKMEPLLTSESEASDSAHFRPVFGRFSDPENGPDRSDSNGSGHVFSVSPESTTRRGSKTRTSRRTVAQDSA